MVASNSSFVPHIQLLCLYKQDSEAFEEACQARKLPSSVSFTVHNTPLASLDEDVKFDTVVSPANSYGRLDGAFDDAISRAFSPIDDYEALTHAAQKRLYEQWRGFAPPGSCTIVRIPEEFHERSRNVWGCKRVALCPTMRVPMNVNWDREVVYECVWSLLCAIDNHNRDVRAGKAPEGEEEIRTILMTPLATGVGRVPIKRWAHQAVLALKHFVEASENPEKWSQMDWHDFSKSWTEVQQTWK
jgi:O-acetyl-ADP-ribose deacetylase (regulator of RNase III)